MAFFFLDFFYIFTNFWNKCISKWAADYAGNQFFLGKGKGESSFLAYFFQHKLFVEIDSHFT